MSQHPVSKTPPWVSRSPSQSYRDGWDALFAQPEEPITEPEANATDRVVRTFVERGAGDRLEFHHQMATTPLYVDGDGVPYERKQPAEDPFEVAPFCPLEGMPMDVEQHLIALLRLADHDPLAARDGCLALAATLTSETCAGGGYTEFVQLAHRAWLGRHPISEWEAWHREE